MVGFRGFLAELILESNAGFAPWDEESMGRILSISILGAAWAGALGGSEHGEARRQGITTALFCP